MAERVHCDGCGKVGSRLNIHRAKLIVMSTPDESWRDKAIQGDVCERCIELMKTRHFGRKVSQLPEERGLEDALSLPSFMEGVPADEKELVEE
jgi:hypothetical protein